MPASQKITDKLISFIESFYFVVLLFGLLLFIRLIFLNCDPSPAKELADTLDEGLWLHNARNMAIFGRWTIDGFNQAFVSSPLFTWLVYLAFKLFGVGFFQARIVSALSGWLTLIVFYFFARRSYPKYIAVTATALLGSINEFLMYNRVAYPETLQLLFISLTFLFWSMAKEKKSYYALSGACFVLAFLSKISAAYLFPAILAIWLLDSFILGPGINYRAAFLFLVGAFLTIAPWLFAVYLPNKGLYVEFSRTIGRANIGDGYNVFVTFISYFNNYFFGAPSVALMLYVLMVYSIGFLINLFISAKQYLKTMPYSELLSIVWIAGGSLILLFGPDQAVRRYIMFFPPIALLSTVTFFRSNISSSLDKLPENLNPALTVLLSIAFLGFFAVNTGGYLTMALLAVIVAITLVWILRGQNKPSMKWLFIWAILLYLPILSNVSSNLSNNLMSISDTLNHLLFAVNSIFFILLSYIAFIKKNFKVAFGFIISLLIIWNLSINVLWLGKPTFTLYNASKYLNGITKKGDIIVGSYSHLLALENKTFPLFWAPDRKYLDEINRDDINKFHPRYMLLTDKTLISTRTRTSINGIKIGNISPATIKKLDLLPFAFIKGNFKTFNLLELR